MSKEKARSRCWNLLLYPDDPTHVNALELIRSSFSYVAILHDRDTEESGELKKPHYHVIIKFSQARWNTALASELGIGMNYMDKTGDFDSSARYLVHDGCDDKFQYETDALEGPLVPAVMKALADVDENVRQRSIYDFIVSSGPLTFTALYLHCIDNGLYADLRRMGASAKWLIDEHNQSLGIYDGYYEKV